MNELAVNPFALPSPSRVVTMTESGKHVWQERAVPKILAYYEQILTDFSINDVTHTLDRDFCVSVFVDNANDSSLALAVD